MFDGTEKTSFLNLMSSEFLLWLWFIVAPFVMGSIDRKQKEYLPDIGIQRLVAADRRAAAKSHLKGSIRFIGDGRSKRTKGFLHDWTIEHVQGTLCDE